MSWTFSINPISKENFDAAVDLAEASGQPANAVGLAEDVAAAKAALKALAPRIKRAKVGGGANGHSLQPEESENWSDSISIHLYGTP